MSHAERGIPKSPDDCSCEHAGLSCSTSTENAAFARGVMPTLRKKQLWYIDFASEDGVYKQTRYEWHHTCWVVAPRLASLWQDLKPVSTDV